MEDKPETTGMLIEYSEENYLKNMKYQLRMWTRGVWLHNPLISNMKTPVTDDGKSGECCPGFECCMPNMRPKPGKFAEALEHNKEWADAIVAKRDNLEPWDIAENNDEVPNKE